jgi:hypothetical protein
MLIPFFICLFVGCIVFVVIGIISRNRAWKELDAARKEYNAVEEKHDPFYAREHCPHKVVIYYRGGNPGFSTFYTPRCMFCHRYLEAGLDPYKDQPKKGLYSLEIDGNLTLIRARIR